MRAARLTRGGSIEDGVKDIVAPGEGGYLWVVADGPLDDVGALQGLDDRERADRYLAEKPDRPRHTYALGSVAAAIFAVDETFPPLTAKAVSLVAGPGWLITVSWGADVVERVWKDREALMRGGADAIVGAILDPILDGYSKVVDSLIRRSETIDDLVLKGTPHLYGDIHRLRRDALTMRQLLMPEIEAVTMLRDHPRAGANPDGRHPSPYINDALARLKRIASDVDGVRDSMSTVVESYASVVANHMNRVMKTLTVVSIVFLPATLIASVYGMNFKIPEFHWSFGYAYSLGLMVVVSASILLYMRARGWFA